MGDAAIKYRTKPSIHHPAIVIYQDIFCFQKKMNGAIGTPMHQKTDISFSGGLMKISKLFVLIMLLVVFSVPFLCFAGQPDSKIWEPFAKDRYYNKKNITKTQNIITVWTYGTVADDIRKKRLANIKAPEKSKKYQRFDHFTILNKVDCQKKVTKIEKVLEYDNRGQVLETIVNKDDAWGMIEAGGEHEKLLNKVCNTTNK